MHAKKALFVLAASLAFGGAVFGTARDAHAMVLTLEGIAKGFTLTTVATGFPSTSSVGPTGIAFPNSGGILVSDYNGSMFRLPTDTDGQVVGAPTATGYNFPLGLVKAPGGIIYLAVQNSNNLVQVTDNGVFVAIAATGIPLAAGTVLNPITGHIYVSELSGSNKIVDVNPVTGVVTPFVNASDPDGLSISSDGKTLYAAVRGLSALEGFDTTTGAIVFTVSVPNIDGTALGSGSLAGKIYANLTTGFVDEIDLTTKAVTVIASGGSRGDFVAVDPSNNSLLLTQTDRILRLTAPAGSGFDGGPTAPIPEPATPFLTALGLGLFGVARRRKNVCQRG